MRRHIVRQWQVGKYWTGYGWSSRVADARAYSTLKGAKIAAANLRRTWGAAVGVTVYL